MEGAPQSERIFEMKNLKLNSNLLVEGNTQI